LLKTAGTEEMIVKLLMPLAVLASSFGLLVSEWTGRAFGYL
jgi:hypothetical protein